MMRLQFQMVKHLDREGFTLVELLIVLSVVSVLTLMVDWRISKLTVNYDNPLHCQIEAMAHKKQCVWLKGLHFNENGNINHAQTIKYKGKTCVFQLGMGRFHCE